MKNVMKNSIIFIAIAVAALIIIFAVANSAPRKEYYYSDIVDAFTEEQVEEFTLDVNTGDLVMTLKPGYSVPTKEESDKARDGENSSSEDTTNDSSTDTTDTTEEVTDATQEPTQEPTQAPTDENGNELGVEITYKVASPSLFIDELTGMNDFNNGGENYINDVPHDIKASSGNDWLWALLPQVFIIGIILLFTLYFMRKMTGGLGGDPTKQMGFGKAKIKDMNDEKRKTTFADVAGADEEKEELEEIVEFLKNPQRYNDLGARIPKGVLLVGPPGTGKTLLARAVAGEAGVPFFSISGSDFVEMFVGVGASRVRDLFDQAKKNSPCIIFIDEIDAVGRQRGTGLGGGHDEREQTLNQLLVEMDGFGVNEGVIMIAATNRPDILDPALMRPGRFDRQIVVGYPDIKGREAILRVHARKKPLAADVKLETVAKSTSGFTGADLENLLNEAALLAARKNHKAITMVEIQEATIKVVVGTEKKTRVMNDKEKKLTAYHEAGHAIAFHLCETQDLVHQISIIPTGMAGGYTMPLPSEDKSYHSKKQMEEDIVVCLGGRAAEALIMGDISTGASNDIQKASATARAMVTKYGMSDTLGPICYGSSGNEVFIGRDMGHVKDYSEKVAAQIDEEVYSIVETGYKRVEKMLEDNMEELHNVAKFLIKHEKMNSEQFIQVMNGTFVDKEEEIKDKEENSENKENNKS